MKKLPRIPLSPPRILPVNITGEAMPRPLWSVMIPVYNCSKYLPEALESVLRQAPGSDKMQIEVCDDASTDADIKQMVAQAGGGRINYFRQPANVGSLRNFETCLNRSRGTLVHILHGDDKVRPGFYSHMERLFRRYTDMGMAFCRYYSIDQFLGTSYMSILEQETEGILDNWLERIAGRQRIQTPSVVVRRAVYEQLGGFYGVHYGEDWEMWLRIAAHYKVGYIPLALAEYRKHDTSITGQYILTGKNIEDLQWVMGISKQYFPQEKWKGIHKKARLFYAEYAIDTARKIWSRYQHKDGTRKQVHKALGLAVNRDIIFGAAKLYIKMLLGIKR